MNILNKSLDELRDALDTDFEKGLSPKALKNNTVAFGLNTPFGIKDDIISSFFKSLLSDVMPWLFLAMCLLSLFTQRSAQLTASIILFFIYILIRLSIHIYIARVDRRVNDYRKIVVTVLRNGKTQKINAENLVPGDVLILKTGDFVPCDCIVIQADSFSVFESFITSEHNAIEKVPQTAIGENDTYHNCLVFTGSAVVSGDAKVLVCHTAKNIFNIKNGPLKKVFKNDMPKICKNNIFVGKQIYLLWVLMCFIVFAIGILMKYDVFDMFFMAVTLSLAALGDCVPLFSEFAVLSSVSRLYKKHGCVLKNYNAIDTFNSTDTVFIENFNYFLNSMPEIKSFYVNNEFRAPEETERESRDEILKYAIASMLSQPRSRRYTDISLVKYASSFGIDLKSISSEFIYLNKYVGEINAVLTFRNGEYAVISRGFAADMLARCTTVKVNNSVREIGRNERFTLQNHIHNMELNSQTVIAIVKKTVSFTSESQDCFIDLDKMTLIALIGFYNPISTDAVKSLALCKKNNINVVLMENAPVSAFIDIAKTTSLFTGDDLFADSQTLSATDEGLFRAELSRYKIFSQLTQQQRLYVAKLYKKNGNILTSIPNTLADIPTQATSDASITAYDEKLPASNYFSDAIFLKKNFSVFTSLIKHSRAIYHNANRMLLFILTNQFLICTLMLAGMIFEKKLIFSPAALLTYGIFSIFPSALAISCDPPPFDKPLEPPDYNRYMFKFLALIPHPFIVGLSGGIMTVLVYRIYNASPAHAASAALITLFTSTFLSSVSLRTNDLFIKRTISKAFYVSLLISVLALALIFAIKPLGAILGLTAPGMEIAFISVMFGLIPFAISEIIKKAKNLTK